jgi:outer membrane receptor protein involved in Fe transport
MAPPENRTTSGDRDILRWQTRCSLADRIVSRVLGNRYIVKNWLLLCLFVCALPLRGQGLTGEIRLDVRDPSGAAMEASGTLQGLSTGVERSFQTNAQGTYAFAGLPYGRYRLEVSRDGFATQSALMDVQSSTPIARTITLALSAQSAQVEVIGTTPLPGVDLSRKEIAAPVQAALYADIEQSGALDLADFLNRRLSGVYLNEVQGNPYQPDLNYRGYTASPLLGTPQGLSVYTDGVRLNQPFGDVVSWDLIPRIAIAEMTLVPGSNPLYGLNTLGGALSIQTKDGLRNSGTAIELSGGSFGRGTAEFEHGGAAGEFHWYLAGNLSFEDGWRTDSPSNVRQFFGKLGWQGGKTFLGLTAAYANNALTGNGLQEQRFLDRDYSSVYTKPDVTENKSPFVILSARRAVSNNVTLSGHSYYRYIRTSTLNGDINEDSLDQSLYQPDAEEQAALAGAGYSGFPTTGETADNTPFPFWRCIAQSLLNDEPAEKCNGLLNRSHARQAIYGLSGQLTWFSSPGGRHNQLTLGASWDGNSVNFTQSTQLGYLNPDRGVTGVNSFGDGVTGGEEDGEPYDVRVNLHGRINTGSVFGTDTLSIGNAWSFTLSGRYNRTTIDNSDRINPGGGSGSLDSHSVFDRFNPAAGITFSPWRDRDLNLYVSYGEGNRAPTSIEVGCADPNQPCKLPNAMAGDPPLQQVVARTWEFGLRGGRESRLSWNAGGFVAENRDDILFVASEQTGFGYFKNFGKTRRQGFEFGASGRVGRVSLGGGYTFLDATYQSPESVNGSSNSTNDAAEEGTPGLEGAIEILPGDKIPFIPPHMVKAYADLQATSKLLVDVGLTAFSGSFARGNENGQHAPDGTYYLGPGTASAYAVVNFGARYQVAPQVQFFVRINNPLNSRYHTSAQLGPTGFTSTGNFIARPFPEVADDEFPVQQATFYAPGAPIGAWAGVRFKF